MDSFEVIVVGAGLAGLAAAYTLADAGVEVVVLERGDYPGAKNVSGGRLYLNPVRGLFPDLWEGAPLERAVVHEGFSLVTEERSVTIRYTGAELRAEPHQSHTVLRSRFDRWLAERAEEKGALILPRTRVDRLLQEGAKVTGVVAGGDELGAKVVIACDGVLSLISESAGLRAPVSPPHCGVGVKEVIELDPERINDRFGVADGEGAAHLYVGEVTGGRFGGGFVYTNRDSVSIGLVLGLQSASEDGGSEDLPTLLDRFKERPEVAPLLRGGRTVEYGAHLIPEGGREAVGRLSGDGILVAGDAAGLALNLGVTVRGMEYALASGHWAARAVLQARESADFGRESLAAYDRMLAESFVGQDLDSFREGPAVRENPRWFGHYPDLVGSVFRDLYAIPDGPKMRLYPTLRKHLTVAELWGVFKDLRAARKL
ncbi:MAG: FAD-dependent oxidoreductase [Thermodesulfobacteriota bacterium]